MALLALAIGWLSVALGLAGGSPEGANSLSLLVSTILPFLSSAFVPPESMPAALRWFVEYQPFTPFVETVRGLLLGTPTGASGPLALAWCVVIAVGGYVWARTLFRREKVR